MHTTHKHCQTYPAHALNINKSYMNNNNSFHICSWRAEGQYKIHMHVRKRGNPLLDM